MRKLVEVKEATVLMTEAMEWSVFKWLFEKSKVRETADQAKEALDASERAVKARWGDHAKAAYKSLTMKAKSTRKGQADPNAEQSADCAILDLVEEVLQADKAAERAGVDAENTFDEAEERLDVAMAREGCRKAIHAWTLREKAIRKAEAVADKLRAKTVAPSDRSEEE